MRESWTDERLDDLKGEVVELRRRMELGFAEARAELKHEIGSVREDIGSVRGEVGSVQREMNARFDSMQRMLIYFQGVVITALVGIATQL